MDITFQRKRAGDGTGWPETAGGGTAGSPWPEQSNYPFDSKTDNVFRRHCAKMTYKQLPANISTMSRQSVWATKVAALIKSNNSQAALAQIKVAPTVKDLQQLRSLMTTDGTLLKHRLIDEATRDQIVALSAPRLHRSP